MKKQISILISLLMTAVAMAQVNFTAQVPPYGIVHRDQLWNLVIVSGEQHALQMQVQLDVVNKQNNQPIFSATSKPFMVSKGSNRIRLSEVSPLTYSYYGSGGNFQTHGLLPVGEYNACYTLVNTHLKDAAFAQDCQSLKVQLLSPPVLNNPADKSVLSEPATIFSWLPPAPVSLMSNPTYDLVMVELAQGQSQLSAIQQNVPVLSMKNLRDNFFNYSLNGRTMDTSKTYAWYITANSNGLPVGQSDIWTFKYQKSDERSAVLSDAFYALQPAAEAAYAAFSQTLKVIYHNDAGDSIVHYTISDLKEMKEGIVAEGDVKVKPGQNFVEMPLKKFNTDRLYVISLVNARKETWSLKFVKTKDQ